MAASVSVKWEFVVNYFILVFITGSCSLLTVMRLVFILEVFCFVVVVLSCR